MFAADTTISKMVWTKRFLEVQEYKIKANIFFLDKLEIKGKVSLGKRPGHFDTKFFYFTDLIKRGEIQIKYCLTKDTMADYMTKLISD